MSRAVLRRRFLGSVGVEAEAGRVRGTMGSRRTTGLLARLAAAGPLKVRVCVEELGESGGTRGGREGEGEGTDRSGSHEGRV